MEKETPQLPENYESPVANSTLQILSACNETGGTFNNLECEILEIMDRFMHLEEFILDNADNLKGIEGAEQIVAQIKEWNQEPPEDFEFCYPHAPNFEDPA